MARKASHLYGLLAFLDPLLRRAPLVVEPHHCPAGCLQVGHDKSDSGGITPRSGTPLSPPHAAPSSSSQLGRGSPCTRPPACGSVFLRAASTTPRCRAPGYHWQVCEWHTLLRSFPRPRKSPAWQRQHRRETPLPSRVLVGAQFPAVTVLPSLPHCARCPPAASLPDSLP